MEGRVKVCEMRCCSGVLWLLEFDGSRAVPYSFRFLGAFCRFIAVFDVSMVAREAKTFVIVAPSHTHAC